MKKSESISYSIPQKRSKVFRVKNRFQGTRPIQNILVPILCDELKKIQEQKQKVPNDSVEDVNKNQ